MRPNFLHIPQDQLNALNVRIKRVGLTFSALKKQMTSNIALSTLTGKMRGFIPFRVQELEEVENILKKYEKLIEIAKTL